MRGKKSREELTIKIISDKCYFLLTFDPSLQKRSVRQALVVKARRN